jgi:glyoxylase-like metal-dependent hydrolase (beta-lactamase superfamily II)
MPGYVVSLVASALLAASGVATATEEFSVERLGEHVFAIVRNDPPGLAVESNSGLIECRDQLVVIDTQSNEATTRRVLAAIRKRFDKPVRYVIDTHWHDDHIVGNRIYRETFPNARFIAHEASLSYLPTDGKKNREKFHRAIPDALAALRTMLESGKSGTGKPLTAEQRAMLASDIHLAEGYLTVPDDFTPVLADVPVKERLAIREPGCAIDVLPLGNAHTTGDLVVHVADARVVFVGDMIGWPVPLVGAEQSRVREWSGTLKRVRDLGAKTIVPGHGPVMRDYTQLDRISTLMSTIARQVDEARARGDTLEAARTHIDLSDLRRQFAGDSLVHATLFDAYVTGPAVANAWNFPGSAGN